MRLLRIVRAQHLRMNREFEAKAMTPIHFSHQLNPAFNYAAMEDGHVMPEESTLQSASGTINFPEIYLDPTA